MRMFNPATVKIKNWGILPFLLMLFCLQFQCKKAQKPLQIPDILIQISPESLSLDLADQALPRLSEGLILLRMRGGDNDIIKGAALEQENNLRKCLLVGAYLSAAQWDWEQFMRRRFLHHAKTPEEYKDLNKEANQLKFAME